MSTSLERGGVTTEVLLQGRIAYAQLPGPRDQDVIKIVKLSQWITVASVVDGWNLRELGTDQPGKEFAASVAERFPEIFLATSLRSLQKTAETTAFTMDREMLVRYPRNVSCVGTFLFMFEGVDILVTIGSVFVLVWHGKAWYRPKTIGDYSLDPDRHPSDVSRFIGRGELKGDPLYSPKPDVTMLRKGKKIFIASDGFQDLFTVNEFNQWALYQPFGNPPEFIARLSAEIENRQSRQKDDISLLLKA